MDDEKYISQMLLHSLGCLISERLVRRRPTYRCQSAFASYDFPTATSTCYHFWLYELCDWYLEYVKPIMYGTDEGEKEMSRDVLYTCLDTGLLLLHPFMPFVTEELFQRLPRRSDNAPPSICVTPYPLPGEYGWRNTDLETEVEFVQNVVKSIRSIRGDYNLTPKMKPEVYLKCLDTETANMLRKHPSLVQILSMTSDVHILVDQAPPQGCAVQTVSAKCESHLMLKGLIDIGKEITKLSAKKEKLEGQHQKVKDATAIVNYETKVPEDIRKQNTEKISELSIEIEKLTQAMATLGSMQ